MGLLFISVTLTACESQQEDFHSIERVDNTLAVVGRIFVHSLPRKEENEGPYQVSVDL